MTNAADKLLNKAKGTIDESLGSPEVRETLAAATTPAAKPGQGPEDGRRRNPDAGILDITRIMPDPNQPRKEFDEVELDRLAESLNANGQLQPVRVRWSAEHSRWLLVFGERRYRAALKAGIKHLKCEFQEQEAGAADLLETQLVENCLREGLTPIELALAYQSLIALRGWNAQQLASRLKTSDASVSRILALLKLPADLQSLIDGGQVAPSTAYEVARIPDDTMRRLLTAQAIEEHWTREQVAAAVQEHLGKRKAAPKSTKRLAVRLATGTSISIAASAEALSLRQIIESLEAVLRRARKAETQQIPFDQLGEFMAALKKPAGRQKKKTDDPVQAML